MNFLFDFSQQPFRNLYDHSDPEEALAVWYDTFNTAIGRHAPVQENKNDETVSLANSGINSLNQEVLSQPVNDKPMCHINGKQ